MERVFVSYRHVEPDATLAAALASFLESNGYEAFLDIKIFLGQSWVDEIERQLRAANHVVVLLSPESILSDMVRHEVAFAHQLKSTRRLTILPILIGATTLPYDLGAYLHSIQYATWCPGQDFEDIFDTVLHAIKHTTENDSPEKEDEISTPLGAELGGSPSGGAPLPSADPQLETGAVSLDSLFYVKRQADSDIARILAHEGITVLIKGPRQVGKTSLLARALAIHRENAHRVLYLDLQLTDDIHFRDEDASALTLYFANHVARDLGLSRQPSHRWNTRLGGREALTQFMEDNVLCQDSAKITIALDEADRLFDYPCRTAFFAMIRAWHNRRATNPLWKRVNMLISHSTEPALFILNINQSPFNVGEAIRLSDFSREAIAKLNETYGGPLKSESEVDMMFSLVGGHPFLVRQALYWLRTRRFTIGQLQGVAATDDGPFADHLRRYVWQLRDNEAIRNGLLDVIHGRGCIDEMMFQRLRAGGLVEGNSRQSAVPRCELYRRYFSKHL